MKILLTADLHLHKWIEFAILNKDGVNTRLLDGLRVLTQMRIYAKKHDIKHVIIAGDLFHKRGIIDVETFNLALAEINKFTHDDIQTWMLDGNHDQATKDGRVHALEAFRAVGAVVTGHASYMLGDSLAVDFYPYDDSGKFVLPKLSTRRGSSIAKIAVMHHGFKGARVGSALEYVVKEPLDPKIITEMNYYDYIFSGHYHARQWLGDNLMYIGSPLEHTRSDKTEAGSKGFLEYDVSAKLVSVIDLLAPKFFTIDTNTDQEEWSGVAGNFIDAVVDDLSVGPTVVETLMRLGARGVKIIARPLPTKVAKRLDVDPMMDSSLAIKRYVKWKAKTTDLDRDKLIQTGKDILKESF